MATKYDSDYLAQSLINSLGGAMEAQANRPQKTSTFTTTTGYTRPFEVADMAARRDSIGATRSALADALKQRENFGYSLGSALAALPAQQGAGSWASDFARGFGGAFNARVNAAIDRAKQDYDAAQADLATALAFDKAMGDITGQTQQQQIGYSGGMESGGRSGQMGSEQARLETSAETLGDVYKTVANNELLFSNLAPLYLDEDSRALKSTVETQGIENLGKNEFIYLQSIMPRGFTSAINTAKEQEMMRPYTTQFAQGTGTAKIAAIKGMVGSIYDAYAKEAKQQGFEMPISKEEYINSRLESGREYNPAFFTGKSDSMYKTNTTELPKPARQKVDNETMAKFMQGTI